MLSKLKSNLLIVQTFVSHNLNFSALATSIWVGLGTMALMQTNALTHRIGLYEVLSVSVITLSSFFFMRRSSSWPSLVKGTAACWILFIAADLAPKVLNQTSGWLDFATKLSGGLVVSLIWTFLPMFAFILFSLILRLLLKKMVEEAKSS